MSSPSAGPTTIELEICTGDTKNVSALLDSVDKAFAIRQLTGCYGGGRDLQNGFASRDSNGLFAMTVPLLHAAYTGDTSMFSTIHGATREKLRAQQVGTCPLPVSVRQS